MILSRSMPCRTDLNHSDDPLTHHEQYLGNLMQENTDTSRVYSHLLKVLLIYKHDIRYTNSPRYLRLWLTFIFYLRTPLIYPTLFGLIDKKIGDKLAMLYEAIAYQQLKERRYHDVEATLLFGIKQEAYPLNKLNLALREFKLTGSLQFDINQFKLESYQAAAQIDKHALHIAKKPRTDDPLKYHLKWIDLRLQHTKRADMLRQCYKKQCSYDELKAKAQYNGLIYNTTNMGQGIKKGGSNIRSSTFYYVKNPTIIPHYSNIPVQEKENDHHQQHNVVQLPHKPGFITHQLMLSGVLDRETYHLLDTESAQNDILIKLKDWFHRGNSKHNPKRLIELDKDTFHVVGQLGQGGMADVYLVQHTKTFAYYGLKVQQPPHPWEYYILSQIHSRKSTNLNVLDIYDFYQYCDASFLLMYFIRNGTLLDALNSFRPLKSYMPEPIVLIIILHLLEELNKLHRIQIVHNDLKLENIMLVSSSSSSGRKTTAGFPKIMMIDFGYSIDVSTLPPHTLCKANWPPACPKSDFPMLNQQYSPFHADYWQLASMAHLLLYGTPMLTLKNKNGFYSIQQAIRRYWHRKVWIDFFQMLLNPSSFNEKEILSELRFQFQQASQDIPQAIITSFASMIDERAFTK